MPAPRSSALVPAQKLDVAKTSTGRAVAQQPPADQPQDQLSALHYEVMDFVQRAGCTAEEYQVKERALQLVSATTLRVLGGSVRVSAFGSHVTHTGLHSSDVDIVIRGLVEPQGENGGFGGNQKPEVNMHLGRLASELRRRGATSKILHIRKARVPILKCTMASGVEVDVSLSGDAPCNAAAVMVAHMEAHPAARPLVMVIKAFLKERGLGNAGTGGLSSFSVNNMVVAHLQAEELAARSGRDRTAKQGGGRKKGRGSAGAVHDAGEMLVRFLERFGREFDYEVCRRRPGAQTHQTPRQPGCKEQAVAVQQGGVVPKTRVQAGEVWSGGGDARQALRITIQDPTTGRDVSSGSYLMHAVRDQFADAAVRLRSMQRGGGVADAADEYADGRYLPLILNTAAALSRSSQRYHAVPPPRFNGLHPPGAAAAEAAAAGRGPGMPGKRAREGGEWDGRGEAELPRMQRQQQLQQQQYAAGGSYGCPAAGQPYYTLLPPSAALSQGLPRAGVMLQQPWCDSTGAGYPCGSYPVAQQQGQQHSEGAMYPGRGEGLAPQQPMFALQPGGWLPQTPQGPGSMQAYSNGIPPSPGDGTLSSYLSPGSMQPYYSNPQQPWMYGPR